MIIARPHLRLVIQSYKHKQNTVYNELIFKGFAQLVNHIQAKHYRKCQQTKAPVPLQKIGIKCYFPGKLPDLSKKNNFQLHL